MGPARESRRDALFDLLAARPNGVLIGEACDRLECSPGSFKEAVQDLRDMLAEDDTINVVCDPQTHIYTLAGRYEEARPWTLNRMVDVERRVYTMRSVTSSVVRGESDRTQKRKAVIINRGLNRIIEDLGDLSDALG
jgi:hypothetical protein